MSRPATGSTSSLPAYYTTLVPFARAFCNGLPILTYHSVGPRPRGVRMKGLYLSAALLDRQLGELRAAGYTTPAYDRVLEPGPSAGKEVLLTFDDGIRKAARHALPILQHHGFRAIQFIVAERIGGTNTWQTAEGEAEERLMDETQIREWLAAGHTIGAHTLTHPWLTRIPVERAREEIGSAKKRLEDRFGLSVDHFCYPYGDTSPAIVAMVQEAGYRTACTTRLGVNSPETSAFELLRIMARYRSRNLQTFLAFVRTRFGVQH